ncbi:MAG TPA: TadE/TadG family type IV pilus assembly protein [Rhizomicrobium sp.]|jgi:Flp pilus assembly protein TadG|nr:TadE/TadG family type IV pilus assembly protein [Rhizomicrobium sp.]
MIRAAKTPFLRSQSGTVAIEFAFIAPILILLFLGTIELCNALICREKVTTIAATASDLVTQDDTITGAQLNDVFAATNTVMYPYPASGTKIIITSVKADPNHANQYIVDWSVPYNTTAHTKGASITIPLGIVTTNGSVVMAEVSYTYTPPSKAVIHAPITMSSTFYSRPRKSLLVAYSP